MTSTQPLIFQGIDGAECEEFIAKLLQRAFEDARIHDPKYIAGLAATCFRGEALRWYLDLDDDVHADWSRLRRAMIAQYPHRSQQRNEPLAPFAIPTPAAAPPTRQSFHRRVEMPLVPRESEIISTQSTSPNAEVSSIHRSIEPVSRRPSPTRTVPESESSLDQILPEEGANVDHQDHRSRNLSRSPTRSTSSRASFRPPKNPPEAEDIQSSAEFHHRPRSTSPTSEKLRDIRDQEPNAGFGFFHDRPHVSTSMSPSSNMEGAGVLLDQQTSTQSLVESGDSAFGGSTIAPRKMTGRLRVVTHGEQLDRGYVTRSQGAIFVTPSSTQELSSITVDTNAALYELSASPYRQSVELQSSTWTRCLEASMRDGGYFSTRGAALLKIGNTFSGSPPGTYAYRNIWKLRDLRIVPELPQDPANSAEWREVSLVLGHDKSARLSPILLLVPSESMSEFSGTAPMTTRWEHVDLLFEVSES